MLAVRDYVNSGKNPEDDKTIGKAAVTQETLRKAFEKVGGRKPRSVSGSTRLSPSP